MIEPLVFSPEIDTSFVAILKDAKKAVDGWLLASAFAAVQRKRSADTPWLMSVRSKAVDGRAIEQEFIASMGRGAAADQAEMSLREMAEDLEAEIQFAHLPEDPAEQEKALQSFLSSRSDVMMTETTGGNDES